MPQVGRLVKELAVKELTNALGEQPNFLIASIGQLAATEMDGLRSRLHQARGRLLLVKQTLARRVLASLQINNGVTKLFEGSVALVVSREDVLVVAKLIVDFAKAGEGRLTVRGGWVDGQVLDRSRIEELASLPSRPQLLANLVVAIEGPLTDLIFTLEGALSELAFVIEEAGKRLPTVEAAPTGSAGSEPPAPGDQPSGDATGSPGSPPSANPESPTPSG